MFVLSPHKSWQLFRKEASGAKQVKQRKNSFFSVTAWWSSNNLNNLKVEDFRLAVVLLLKLRHAADQLKVAQKVLFEHFFLFSNYTWASKKFRTFLLTKA